jgi:hypothetical protein
MRFSKINIGLDLKNMFKDNKALIHLDLSHNNLRKEDCRVIEEGLNENHTLLGIHMVGNDINTNS